jgi:hypothetical protein
VVWDGKGAINSHHLVLGQFPTHSPTIFSGALWAAGLGNSKDVGMASQKVQGNLPYGATMSLRNLHQYSPIRTFWRRKIAMSKWSVPHNRYFTLSAVREQTTFYSAVTKMIKYLIASHSLAPERPLSSL